MVHGKAEKWRTEWPPMHHTLMNAPPLRRKDQLQGPHLSDVANSEQIMAITNNNLHGLHVESWWKVQKSAKLPGKRSMTVIRIIQMIKTALHIIKWSCYSCTVAVLLIAIVWPFMFFLLCYYTSLGFFNYLFLYWRSYRKAQKKIEDLVFICLWHAEPVQSKTLTIHR